MNIAQIYEKWANLPQNARFTGSVQTARLVRKHFLSHIGTKKGDEMSSSVVEQWLNATKADGANRIKLKSLLYSTLKYGASLNECHLPDWSLGLTPVERRSEQPQRAKTRKEHDQEDEKRYKRGRKRTGCIYSEITNHGRSTIARGIRGCNTVIYTSRWVGEICVNYKRYRFRSTNYDNVRWWLSQMCARFSDYTD